MGKKKSKKQQQDALPSPEHEEEQSGPMDHSVLASVLSVDHPLLEPSLIYAMLLDYDASELRQNEQTIRDQLGMLEATTVPDNDDSSNIRSDTPTPSDSRCSSFLNTQTTSFTDSYTDNVPEAFDDEDPQDEADLLKAFFPNLPQRDLDEALSTEPTLEAAIDHLLSVELINNVGRTGQWPDEPDTDSDAGAFRPAPSRKNSRSPTKRCVPLPAPSKKKKKNTSVTIPLVDTLQRRTNGRSAPVTPITPNSAGVIPATSTDVWTAYSSLTEALAEIVPRATPSYFKSYLHSGDYESAHEATLAALGALAASNARLGEDLADEAWQIFEDLYGVSRDSDAEDDELSDTLFVCIGAAEGDVMSVMDLMNIIHDLRFWPDYEASKENARDPFTTLSSLEKALPKKSPTPPATTTRAQNGNRLTRPQSEPAKARKPEARVVPGSRPPPGSGASTQAKTSGASTPVRRASPKKSTSVAPYTQRFAPSPVNWKTVNAKRPKRGAHPLAASIPAYARAGAGAVGPVTVARDPEALTPAECYRRGAEARHQREEAMRAAGRHFRSGQKHIQASVAGHYAQQAREATQSARDWELRGARLVIDQQLEQSRNTIDLHYMTVEQAVTLAREAAARWAQSNAGGTLVIVTGKGIHSVGNRGVLGPAVQKALAEEGYRVTRQDGYLAVRGR